MAAPYRWRRNELVDFSGVETSPGFAPAARLSAGGVHVSRGRLAANEGIEIGAAQLVIAVVESDAFEVEWRPAGEVEPRRQWVLPNSVQILPAEQPCYSRWGARPTILAIAFDRKLVEKLRSEIDAGRRHEVSARIAVRDPDVDAVVSKLRLELQFGGWSGRLYVESLGIVLAVHLIRNYAGDRISRVARGGLGPRRMRRIIEYIEAHLGEEITLAELAGIAALSPHHFASAFRTSAGVAPHRYVMERRIARASELLAKSHATVTTVAHALGFASHGHFTASFRRFVGVTPSQFKANCR